MASRKSRAPSKVVQLTALGFSLTIGAAAASAATGIETGDTGARLASLSQARAEGRFDIAYRAPVTADDSKPHRSLEMRTAQSQFASRWSNSD